MKESIAIFLPNWIGDVVMATPALRNLRQHVGPNVDLIGVCRPYIREVLTGSSWLDDMLWYHPQAVEAKYRPAALVRELRERAVNQVLMLTNSLRSAYIAWRCGARKRVGYARNGRGILLTQKLKPRKVNGRFEPVSAVDYYLQLIENMGVRIHSRQPELYTTAQGELAASQVWEQFQWEPYHSVITMNTGGAYGAAKHWPNNHSAELAKLLARAGHRVLIMCGPKEVDVARDIQHRAQHPFVQSMADQDLSLEASKACLRRATVMVSTDSGPRHIAAAFDVPTVTLFGPIDPRWSYNYASQAIDMFDNLDCSPCAKRVCPLGHHRCMKELTPQRVFAAVNSLLGSAEAENAA